MPNQPDVFSGIWRMNPQKSEFDPNHRPTQGTLRFERESGGYLMRAEGTCDGKRVEEQPQRFLLDGKPHPVPGAPGVIGISSLPDPHTLRAEARIGDRVVGEGTYVVSADGSTLTATVRGMDTQQRAFQTTVVWDREPA